jgi:putative spermidine/putrescine transport system permease protein
MARASTDRQALLLMLPSYAMLTLTFVAPLVWFFVRVLLIDATPAALPETIVNVITSRPMLIATVATNWISLLVTATTLLLGYPIAYYLANRGGIGFTLVVFCVIVPYFTSVIVRTYSWMVLLGRNGIINQLLIGTGLIQEPLPLLYNKFAIVVGMTYVLLPYMVLTLYAAMKAIDPSLTRAAQALGADALYVFRRVYFPLTLHGVISGSLIVFILSIGFFITPALMGGPSDVMVAMLIERSIEITLDWPTATVMSLFLLLVTLALYAIYYRVTDIRRLMGG